MTPSVSDTDGPNSLTTDKQHEIMSSRYRRYTLHSLRVLTTPVTLARVAEIDDQHLINFFPFLVRRADPSDEAAEMILDSVLNGDIPLRKISQIETIARSGELSEEMFLEIGSYLIDEDSGEAVAILVNLAEDFYRRDDAPSINEDLIIQALTHPSLVNKESEVAVGGHWIEWEQLAEMAIKQDITNGYDIAGPIIGNEGKHRRNPRYP